MPHRRPRRRPFRAGPAPRRPRAGFLAVLLALLVAALAPAGPASAQAIDLRGLLGGPEAPAEPEAPAAPPERDRPPELAAYGALEAFETEGSMARRTTENVGVFRQRIERILRESRGGWTTMTDALARRSPDGTAGYFVGVALVTAVLILIGRGVVMLLAVYVFRPMMVRAQRRGPPVGLTDKLPVLTLRLAITVFAAAVNALVALGLGLALVGDHAPTQLTALILVAAYSLYALVDVAWRMAICPYLSDYRIPALTDTQARRLYLWMTTLAAFSISGQAWLLWQGEMGLPDELVDLNALVLRLAAVAFALTIVWRNRAGVTRAILRGRPRAEATWPAALGARLWAPAATLYLLAAGAEETVRIVLGLDTGPPLLTGVFVTLMVGLAVYAGGLYAVERLFARARAAAATRIEAAARDRAERVAGAEGPPSTLGGEEAGDGDGDGDEGGGRVPAPPSAPAPGAVAAFAPPGRGMTSFEDLAARVVSLLALGVAGYALIRIWAGPGAFAEDAPLGRVEDVLDTLLLGYVAYHAARIWLDRKIAEEGGPEAEPEPGDEGGGASAASRLATLLPLFRSAILVTIGVSVVLLMAVEFGLNVAPLFAGAGVVGLAVGFGAQTLVRDILSGMFFLLDDAFRKGEYIDVGQVKGVVEKISLRSFQLRHHLGALHTIPFGEIQHLTNFSRDWVMMKLPLRVTYDTDVEKVRKLVKKLGEELLRHPTEGPKFMQPLKSQGVYMMDDSAMIIRVKYMTRPGDQWTTRKLVYQRIRELFEAEGIKFAHREVTVRIPDLKGRERDLTDDEAAAVGAAARRAVDQAEEDAGPRPGPLAAVEGR